MIFGKRAFFGYQILDDGSGGWFVNLPHPAPMKLAQTRAVAAEQWLRVVRDLRMPVAMKRLAKPEKMAWQFDHRIGWDAPIIGDPHRVTART